MLNASNIGSILSGVALLLVAAAAWRTYFKFSKITLFDNWINRQSSVYDEFWNVETNFRVRWYIISDIGYRELVPVLIKRLSHEELTLEEYEKIEALDRFIMPMARFRYFDSETNFAERRALWDRFFGLWIKEIRKRKELSKYIEQYWDDAKIFD
ncbi:MAG: hypothetical protein KDK08_29660 [Rhizobiaceae bacterium]|nr:hypothetical protein [Rhizobiaceae bacterium]